MAGRSTIDMRLFVVGSPRSGTTLVQSLLAAHSTMTSFTESHFFSRHFRVLPLLRTPVLTRDPTHRLRRFLAENDEKPPPAAEWFDDRPRGRRARVLLPLQTRRVARQLLAVLDELARRRGQRRWVEKTPLHLRYVRFLDRISRPVAPARFVHVIRNGSDVVASLHAASKEWQRPYDLETCVRRWNRDMRTSLERAASPSDRFVFYEDLTSAPETTLDSLFSGLGLEFEPAILDRYAEAANRLVTDSETWKSDIGRDIRPSRATRGELTEAQRERAARDLRRELYEELRSRLDDRPMTASGSDGDVTDG